MKHLMKVYKVRWRIRQPLPGTPGQTHSHSNKSNCLLLCALHNAPDLRVYIPSKGWRNWLSVLRKCVKTRTRTHALLIRNTRALIQCSYPHLGFLLGGWMDGSYSLCSFYTLVHTDFHSLSQTINSPPTSFWFVLNERKPDGCSIYKGLPLNQREREREILTKSQTTRSL